MPFIFKGHQLDYANWPGERKMEVPIARLYVAKHPDLVEVGAVMPYHGKVFHTIYDPYDPYPCDRTDGYDVDYTNKHVLSISTIEHIGVIQYGNTVEQLDKGFLVLQKILSQATTFLVAWPLGFNRTLDAAVRQLTLPAETFFMKQVASDIWEEAPINWKTKYGSPFGWGNGVIFITNEPFWQ